MKGGANQAAANHDQGFACTAMKGKTAQKKGADTTFIIKVKNHVAASARILESEGYVLNECSKLLGFSEKVLLSQENAYSKITDLAKTISAKIEYLKELIKTLKHDMTEIKEQKEKQKQENKIKVAEKSIGYLGETSKHLYEIANRIPKEKRDPQNI